jgi:hypothetical protein
MVDNAIQPMIWRLAAQTADSLEILNSSRLTKSGLDSILGNDSKALEISDLRHKWRVMRGKPGGGQRISQATLNTSLEIGMSLTLVLVAFTVGATEGGSKDRHSLPF